MGAARLLEYAELGGEVWAALAAAVEKEHHPFHLVALATVSADGSPTARTMAVRAVDRESGCVYLHADRRSPKVSDLRGNPRACILALDKERGIQVRLSGRAAIHEH